MRPAPLHWLTFLRYPATLWVILKHCLHNFGDSNAIPESGRKAFMEHGFLGVPFFFILSGFILAYNYPVIRSKADYLAARAGRILPVYYLSILCSVPLMIILTHEHGLGFGLSRTFLYLTLTQAWFPNMHSFGNFPTWTLSCEVFFYALLVIMLIPLQRFISGSPGRAALFITGCFFFGLIAPTIFYFNYGDPPAAAFDDVRNAGLISASNDVKIFVIWHLAEFFAGVALCIGVRSRLESLAKYAWLLIMLGALQIASCFLFPIIFSQGTYCLPGFVLLILGFAVLPFPDLKTASPLKKWLGSTAILLGNASYSVYLFHVPFIAYLGMIGRHALPILPKGEAGVWTLYAETTVLATAFGLAVFYLYEQPCRERVRAWLGPRLKWLDQPAPVTAGAQESA